MVRRRVKSQPLYPIMLVTDCTLPAANAEVNGWNSTVHAHSFWIQWLNTAAAPFSHSCCLHHHNIVSLDTAINSIP